MLVHTTWDACAVHVYVRVHVFYDLQLLLVKWHSEKSLIEKDIVIVECCSGRVSYSVSVCVCVCVCVCALLGGKERGFGGGGEG